jgi:hypothetical protein
MLKLATQGLGGISQYYKIILLTCEIISQYCETASQYCGTTAMVYEVAWIYCEMAARERPGSAGTAGVPKMAWRVVRMYLFGTETVWCMATKKWTIPCLLNAWVATGRRALRR